MVGKITKEDELLLERYSRAASKKSNHLIHGNAVLISVMPIWLFWRIYSVPLVSSAILFGIFSVLCAFLISYAYRQSKSLLLERVALKRADFITKEVLTEAAKDKKVSRKDLDDAIRERTREVAEYESTTFAIFFNNCVYLTTLLLSSMLFQNLSGQVNYAISMSLASGLTAFLSSGKGSM